MLMVEDIKEKQTTKESTDKVGKITFNDYILEPKEVISLPFQIVIPKSNLISSISSIMCMSAINARCIRRL
jgi:hypothetical protein